MKLADKVDLLLRESYGLGATQKEFGGDKVMDMVRLNKIRDEIFDLFREEMEDIMLNQFRRSE